MGSEKGTSFVELAIALPMLVLIVLGAIEFSRVIRIKQEVHAFNEQIANAIFRDCRWAEKYQNFGGTPAQKCINRVLNPLDPTDAGYNAHDPNSLTNLVSSSSVSALFKGAELSLGLYACRLDSTTNSGVATVLGGGGFPNVSPPFTKAQVEANQPLMQNCLKAGVIAVSKTSYGFKAVMPVFFGKSNYVANALSIY